MTTVDSHLEIVPCKASSSRSNVKLSIWLKVSLPTDSSSPHFAYLVWCHVLLKTLFQTSPFEFGSPFTTTQEVLLLVELLPRSCLTLNKWYFHNLDSYATCLESMPTKRSFVKKKKLFFTILETGKSKSEDLARFQGSSLVLSSPIRTNNVPTDKK